MSYEQITTEVERARAHDHAQPARSAQRLDATMGRELIEAFDRADADDEVRVVIVTGAGRGVLRRRGSRRRRRHVRRPRAAEAATSVPRDSGGQFTLRIFDCTKPVIAAINGAGGRGRRDDDAADGRPARRRERPHRLRVRPPRDRPRGVLELVPAAGRRHQPGDGVGATGRVFCARGGARRGPGPQPPSRRGAARRRGRARPRDRRQHRAGVGGAGPPDDVADARCRAPDVAHRADSRGMFPAASRPTPPKGSRRSSRSAPRSSPTGSATGYRSDARLDVA